jgi:hypothetical protein
MARNKPWLWLVGAVWGALLANGSAASARRDERMLAELAAMLGGSYDNLAQSRTAPDHPALRLMIVPVQAPLVGDRVYYVQEMAADDPRRVFAQRVYTLDKIPKREQAVMTQLELNEPLRWRDGHLNRDLFRSLLLQDMRARPGCDLLWSRKEKGFAAAMGSRCRIASRATGETLKVEQRMELTADGITLFEQHRDAGGTLQYGDMPDPQYRFARRADTPW